MSTTVLTSKGKERKKLRTLVKKLASVIIGIEGEIKATMAERESEVEK